MRTKDREFVNVIKRYLTDNINDPEYRRSIRYKFRIAVKQQLILRGGFDNPNQDLIRELMAT